MQPTITGNFAALPTRVVLAASTQLIFRNAIEREIERLISILDGIDGDPDLEDSVDGEPWLGWTEAQVRERMFCAEDDRQEENEHGGDVRDEEYAP
ncbi:MAG TPA: hypothetical protein VGE05_15515 [Novosphingobium sp.]